MNFRKPLSIFLVAAVLGSCAYESPEILPCACNTNETDLGLFPCTCNWGFGSDNKNQKAAPRKETKVAAQQQVYQPEEVVVRRTRRVAPAPVAYTQPAPRKYVQRTYTVANVDAVAPLSRNDMASLKLEYVDFRLEDGGKNYSTKLGDYRFRIFGCRRESKNVFLNQGRALEKDMRFFDIFFENMNEQYPVVVDKNSALYPVSDHIKVPEYLLTAEITDYHMNICDEFDWNKTKKKNTRNGTSEITITWRLMDLCKSHVYWKGTTSGYGEVTTSESNGETLLVERAYQDALSQLPYAPGFEEQMAKRISPKDLLAQKSCWDKFEKKADSFQCQYKREMSCAADEPVYYDTPCVEDGGYRSGGRQYEALIEEDGGDCSDGQVYEGRISERGGSDARGRTYKSEVSEKGGSCALGDSFEPVKPKDNIAFVEDYWVDIPLDGGVSDEVIENREIVENSLLKDKNSLCIMSQRPYAKLTPENLYRVRASIVAVDNPNGKKGAGLLISDQFILTSADLLNKNNNRFNIQTINGKTMKASAFRVNPNKNVALLLLDNKTQYKPLALALDLPEVNKDVLMTLGMKDLSESEGYLDSNAKVTGYRYSPEKGAEIMVDTRVQQQTLGGALIDKSGNIVGLAHSGKKLEDGPDLFIPIETALKALDMSLCDKNFVNAEPWKEEVVVETTTATAIDSDTSDKAPVVMEAKERK